jgi:hypothetical protein
VFFLLGVLQITGNCLFADPPQGNTGIASYYPGDVGIENDPCVIFVDRFEVTNWYQAWGVANPIPRTDIVDSDAVRLFEPFQNKAMRVRIDQDDHYGLDLKFFFRDHLGYEPEKVYWRYYLRFGDDWDPHKGGKMPGIAGTYNTAGWGGRPATGADGWSARGQMNGQVNGETPIGFYVYHVDRIAEWGEEIIWENNRLGYLQNNRWYCIEQYCKMNTPGLNDGILRGWVDGQLAYERTDFLFRTVDTLKIETIWVNVYQGGSWVALSDHHLYIDNVVMAHDYIGPAFPAPEPLRSDIDHSDSVDLIDLAKLADDWGDTFDTTLGGWYKFDESSGTTAHDFAGFTRDGVIKGEARWAPTSGQFGGAVDLGWQMTASDGAIEFPTTAMSAAAGTISVWAKVQGDQTGTRYIFGHTSLRTGGFADRIQIYMDNSDYQLDVGLGGNHTAATNVATLAPDTWYHLVLTWGGGSYTMYVNGSPLRTGIYSSLANLAMVAHIGNSGREVQNEGFQGLIDNVHIYTRALTAPEVVALATEMPPVAGDGDINKDSSVNWLDMEILAEEWLQTR